MKRPTRHFYKNVVIAVLNLCGLRERVRVSLGSLAEDLPEDVHICHMTLPQKFTEFFDRWQ